MYKIKIEKFEGPLTLLLDLIERNKLDITEISLAEVADQYLRQIDERREQIDGEELADWLLLAAKLLVIKSRSLLPNLEADGEEESDLARQLKMYKVYRDASLVIKKIISEKNFTFGREAKYLTAILFRPPEKLTPRQLRDKFAALLEYLEKTLIRLPRQKLAAVVSLTDRIKDLKQWMVRAAEFGFGEFLKDTQSRAEVIVSFLALLELIKQRELVAVQSGSEIVIKRY